MRRTNLTVRERLLEHLRAGGSGSVEQLAAAIGANQCTLYRTCRDLHYAGLAARTEQPTATSFLHLYSLGEPPKAAGMVHRAIAAQPELACVWHAVARTPGVRV